MVTILTARYHMTLNESKRLNAPGLIERAKANNINADVILYNYAIEMVIENFCFCL